MRRLDLEEWLRNEGTSGKISKGSAAELGDSLYMGVKETECKKELLSALYRVRGVQTRAKS